MSLIQSSSINRTQTILIILLIAIAGLLIHRIVAVINYTYLMNKGESLGLSSSVYKTDPQTIQLEFKFNL